MVTAVSGLSLPSCAHCPYSRHHVTTNSSATILSLSPSRPALRSDCGLTLPAARPSSIALGIDRSEIPRACPLKLTVNTSAYYELLYGLAIDSTGDAILLVLANGDLLVTDAPNSRIAQFAVDGCVLV